MAGELTTSDGSGNANIVYILYLAGVSVSSWPILRTMRPNRGSSLIINSRSGHSGSGFCSGLSS